MKFNLVYSSYTNRIDTSNIVIEIRYNTEANVQSQLLDLSKLNLFL